MQAGSYIQDVLRNPKQAAMYTKEFATILEAHVTEFDSLLDIGTGELTTLSSLICKLKILPKEIYAFDLSWSRIFKGKNYAKEITGDKYPVLKTFVADIGEIPLLDKSINITISSHALEPNGGKLKELMSELFRITIDKLLLFEPCYEINTDQGKKRMDSLGYNKNIDAVVKELGGEIKIKIVIKNISNPLNPTVCFVITPPLNNKISGNKIHPQTCIFSVPCTNIPLEKFEEYYYSDRVGLCYPILKSIPILKSNTAILASALTVENR